MNERASTLLKVKIFVNGRRYVVPSDKTIMEAMEYAGYRFIRGSGCRQGMCGACATLYRIEGDYKLRNALACQELVEDGMYICMVLYSPAKKAFYNFEELRPSENILLEYYPEIARCVSCNTCTRTCPQDLEVMQIVQAALRGDITEAAELSFDCIECGLCAMRCPAEIVPYYVARLARRIYAKHIVGLSRLVESRVKDIEEGRFDESLEEYTKIDLEQLKKLYEERSFL